MAKSRGDGLIELETKLKHDEFTWVKLLPDGKIDTDQCGYCGHKFELKEKVTVIEDVITGLVAVFCDTCLPIVFRQAT